MNRNLDHMSSEGVPIRLRAAFISLKGMPSLFAVGHNNINPELTFFGDRVEIRSVKRYQFDYEDIKEVGSLKTMGTRNVRFKVKGGILNHTANVKDDASLAEVLHFLKGKGIPLTAGAKKLLTKLQAIV